MSKILHSFLKKIRALTLEEWGVALFGVSFFLGVWYAFPMVNTVSDVWAFGGGVLRSMEAHSLLPVGNVAYGTVSFYQNYLFMAVALGISFVFSGFDIEAVKAAFVLNPYYSLLVTRIVSVLTAMVFLVVVYRFLRHQVQDAWWRIALLLLLFGNVITIFLVRSGKMWILSMTLVTISFILLYYALTKERQQGVPGKYALFSILAAALAAANFAFAALFFVAIPILFFAFPKTYTAFRALFLMSLAGFGIVFSFFLLNAENILEQISGFFPAFLKPVMDTAPMTPTEGTLSLVESIRVKARHAVEAFPLFLLAIVAVMRSGVRDRTLVLLAAFYGLLHMSALVFVFRTDHDIALNVRHVFPLAIFLTFFLAGLYPPRKFVSGTLIITSGLLYLYTVTLLSLPTTYNNVYDYVVEQYADKDIVIEERIFELTLPMNKASFELFTDDSCASTCQYRRSLETDIAFRPLVITNESDPIKVGDISSDVIITEQGITGCVPLARFGNPVPDDETFDIDINLGRILMSSFYEIRQLGKNLYVYQTATCPDVLDER